MNEEEQSSIDQFLMHWCLKGNPDAEEELREVLRIWTSIGLMTGYMAAKQGIEDYSDLEKRVLSTFD